MVVVFTGVVLMEIAEAHRKIHSELDENVSLCKINLDALLLLLLKQNVCIKLNLF